MNEEMLDIVNPDTIQKLWEQAISWALWYAPKIIGAILALWIGFKIANLIGRAIEAILNKRKIDKTVESFVVSLIKNVLKALVIVASVGMLGVETSSFVAMFAAVGLAVGMALSGTLSHFASGIMILLFKPYKVGDLIKTSGHEWVVKEVQIFNTILKTVTAKTIIIPNSDAIGWSIVNFSMEKKKRVDINVGISYEDSIDKAREVLQKIADEEPMVLKKEWVTIGVKELWDNAVIITFRTWVKTTDYWSAFFTLNETIKKEFDATNWELNFPFPQRDVHLYNQK